MRTGILAVALILVSTLSSLAQDTRLVREISSITTIGTVNDLLLRDTVAYVATSDSGLQVITIGDPRNPRQLGFVDSIGPLAKLVNDANFLYVAAGDSGIQTIFRSSLAKTDTAWIGAPAYGLAVVPRYLYVASGIFGLKVLGYTHKNNNSLTVLTDSSSFDTPGFAYDVVVDGSYSFIADGDSGVIVLYFPGNFRRGDQLQLAGSYHTGGTCYGIALDDDFAFVADGANGLRVLYLVEDRGSHTYDITEVGFFNTIGSAKDVSLSRDFAFVSDGDGGVRVIDIFPLTEIDFDEVDLDSFNPIELVETGFINTAGDTRAALASGNNAYAADGEGGFMVLSLLPDFDLSGLDEIQFGLTDINLDDVFTIQVTNSGIGDMTVANITSAGSFTVPFTRTIQPRRNESVPIKFSPRSVEEFASIVTFASGDPNVADVVVDVTGTGVEIIQLGHVDTPGEAWQVAVQGSYGYIADGDGGFRVVDISDVENPHEVGSVELDGWSEDVAVEGNRAYVASRFAGLYVVNIADPNNPEVMGLFTPEEGSEIVSVTVFGNVVYATEEYQGIYVLNVSDPTNPVLANHIRTPGRCWDIMRADNNVYVADHNRGVFELAEADMTNPGARGISYGIPEGFALSVDVFGGLGYVSSHDAGLIIVNISNPNVAPLASSGCETRNFAYASASSAPYSYIADFDGGLFVVDIGDYSYPDTIGWMNSDGPMLGMTFDDRFAYAADGIGGMKIYYTNAPGAIWNYNSVTEGRLPQEFTLAAPYPNPFNGSVRLGFVMPNAQSANLVIYDMMGRQVTTLLSGQVTAGEHTLVWNANNLPSGMYLARLQVGNKVSTMKMNYVR